MRSAFVILSVALMATGMLFVTSASAKVHKANHLSHTGTFVSASNGKLVMTGRNGKEHTHAVAKDAKIMIDGKAGTLAGLKKGTHISVTTDTTGSVTAVTTPVASPAKGATTAKPASTAAATPAVAKPVSSATPSTPPKTTGK
jgi:hypothetical protein